MTTYVALLRAVNVAGHQPVGMGDLRALLTHLGLSDPRSLLQSGNLLFGARVQAGEKLERLLESGVAERLGLKTHVFVRSAGEWAGILARNPFPKEAAHDPARLHVTFLKTPPVAGGLEALRRAVKGPEVVRGEGRELFIVYPDGAGRSRLTNALIETKLGTRGTARNWNTVRKLAALATA